MKESKKGKRNDEKKRRKKINKIKIFMFHFLNFQKLK